MTYIGIVHTKDRESDILSELDESFDDEYLKALFYYYHEDGYEGDGYILYIRKNGESSFLSLDHRSCNYPISDEYPCVKEARDTERFIDLSLKYSALLWLRCRFKKGTIDYEDVDLKMNILQHARVWEASNSPKDVLQDFINRSD